MARKLSRVFRSADAEMRKAGLGVQLVDLPTADLNAGTAVRVTFYWPQAD